MTPEFLLIVHLAGAAPFDGGRYATRELCEAAGRERLRRVKHRSPNDHTECVEVKP